MIDVQLDNEYTGPDIQALETTIPDISDDVVKVRWTHTKDELRVLNQFPNRNFLLVVPDSTTFDKVVATFGKRLTISKTIIERAKLVLRDQKSYDWRKFTVEVRDAAPRYILMQLAADSIRNGNKPNLAEIVSLIFSDGVSAVDADVLLRLKSGRIRG